MGTVLPFVTNPLPQPATRRAGRKEPSAAQRRDWNEYTALRRKMDVFGEVFLHPPVWYNDEEYGWLKSLPVDAVFE